MTPLKDSAGSFTTMLRPARTVTWRMPLQDAAVSAEAVPDEAVSNKPATCQGGGSYDRELPGGGVGGAGGGNAPLGTAGPEPLNGTTIGGGALPLPSENLCQTAFRGMRDSEDSHTADPQYARLCQNVYPFDSGEGARLVGRPGLTQAGAQLGAGSLRRVQGIYQWTSLAGTAYTIAICGGKFYTYNWSTSTWTEDTPSAATISTTATCYFATISDKVVVSDGVNKPWTWDGTDDVELTSASVMYGQPTVYYAKLFGIKNSERSTLIWSEENDPTTGYEASGYNNAWTLGQTDQEPLYAIHGTNEALYYWRARSMGAIRGAVDADFSNSGTSEGVSTSLGTISPNGIAIGDDKAYFPDADGKVRVLNTSSGNVTPYTWRDIKETLTDWDQAQLGDSRSVFDTETGMALIGMVADSSTECDRWVCVNAESLSVVGLFKGWTATSIALVKNAAGVPTIMHGSLNGYLYTHGTPNGTLWTDALNATDGGTTAIEHKVTGAHLGAHMKQTKRFVRWDLITYLETAMTSCTLTYKTPRGTPSAQTKTASATSYPAEAHIAVGLDGQGRWILPDIVHQSGVERFGLSRWCVEAVTYGTEPEVP